MSNYMSQEEREEIMKLHRKGVPQKDIAAQFGRAKSSVCYIVKHGHERKIWNRGRATGPVEAKPMETLDLSSLPDNILFKHSKEYCF